MLAITQTIPRAERGTGALTIAVDGHWNSRMAGNVGSSRASRSGVCSGADLRSVTDNALVEALLMTQSAHASRGDAGGPCRRSRAAGARMRAGDGRTNVCAALNHREPTLEQQLHDGDLGFQDGGSVAPRAGDRSSSAQAGRCVDAISTTLPSSRTRIWSHSVKDDKRWETRTMVRPLRDAQQIGTHNGFAFRIERTRRLVEDQNARVVDQRARDRQSLGLSTREIGRTFFDIGLVAVRHALDEFFGAGKTRCLIPHRQASSQGGRQ